MSGYIEKISTREISGWSNIGPMEVVINGKVCGAPVTTGVRQDCIDAGYPNARGVYFRPTRYLVSGDNHIVVRECSSLAALGNGDQIVTYDPLATIDAHWSTQYAGADYVKSRWWQCEQIVKHVNRRICGEPVGDILTGLHRWIKQVYGERLPLQKGVSVGCGQGQTELQLLQAGMVQEFDLYELSSFAVVTGQAQAEAKGLGSRANYHQGDAFAVCDRANHYDLVLWQQALHHMPDVDAALAWTRSVLRPGGLVVLHEYVGPTRFQFRQGVLDVNTEWRRSLPAKYLANPRDSATTIPIEVVNPDLDELIFTDPSEGMDSARILPCLWKYFPDARVRLTGGLVYHLGLNDVLHNLMADGATELIDQALALDDAFIEVGETQYAVAIAAKQD